MVTVRGGVIVKGSRLMWHQSGDVEPAAFAGERVGADHSLSHIVQLR